MGCFKPKQNHSSTLESYKIRGASLCTDFWASFAQETLKNATKPPGIAASRSGPESSSSLQEPSQPGLLRAAPLKQLLSGQSAAEGSQTPSDRPQGGGCASPAAAAPASRPPCPQPCGAAGHPAAPQAANMRELPSHAHQRLKRCRAHLRSVSSKTRK